MKNIIQIPLFFYLILIIINNIECGTSPKKNKKDKETPQEEYKKEENNDSLYKSHILPSMRKSQYNRLNLTNESFRKAATPLNYSWAGMKQSPITIATSQFLKSTSSHLDINVLSDFCSTSPSDYFEGIELNDSIEDLFNNKSLFELRHIEQKLFANNSASDIYSKRKLFWIKYHKDNSAYIVKRFLISQLKYAFNELMFYNNYIKNNEDRKEIFSTQHGCIMDDNYIYILFEKNRNYFSLSDGTVYNKMRNDNLIGKLKTLVSLSTAVNEINEMGFLHNMISPDSFIIDHESNIIKLIHFENITQINNPSINKLKSLTGVIYDTDEIIDFNSTGLLTKNVKLINSDMYALVKVMLHLDDKYFESRIEKDDHEKYDKLYKPPHESIVNLYELPSYSTIGALLSFIQSKCEHKPREKVYKGFFNSMLSNIFSSSTQNNEDEYVVECHGLQKIYEDMLKVDSLYFIPNTNILLERLRLLLTYKMGQKATLYSISKNMRGKTFTMPSRKTLKI